MFQPDKKIDAALSTVNSTDYISLVMMESNLPLIKIFKKKKLDTTWLYVTLNAESELVDMKIKHIPLFQRSVSCLSRVDLSITQNA